MNKTIITVLTNFIIFSGIVALLVFWFFPNYQYIISWVLLFWYAFSIMITVTSLYGVDKIRNKMFDNVTPWGFQYESSIFVSILFGSIILGCLSLVITLILVIISLYSAIQKMGNTKHIMPYDIHMKLVNYKIAFIAETVATIIGMGFLYTLPSDSLKNTNQDAGSDSVRNIMYMGSSIAILVPLALLYVYGVDFYQNGTKYIQLVNNEDKNLQTSLNKTTPPVTDTTDGEEGEDITTPAPTTPKATVPLGDMCYE